MINPFIKILGVLFLMSGLISCDSNKVFEEYIEVKGANWQKENVASGCQQMELRYRCVRWRKDWDGVGEWDCLHLTTVETSR